MIADKWKPLHVIADAAVFTAGQIKDEAYEQRLPHCEFEAAMSVARGWERFADNLRSMAFRLEEEGA